MKTIYLLVAGFAIGAICTQFIYQDALEHARKLLDYDIEAYSKGVRGDQ